jgi:ribonucleotide monophosphatase NagD (HAD superfamily)
VLTSVVGKQLVFVTNNSTKSRADYKKKFDKLGIPAEVVREKRATNIDPS